MEPATMSDLKDFMKELRESIKEAVAEAFGNSKPALEHATTSIASELDAFDAKVPPPACSSLDLGTSALYLASTTTIDILPELNIDATDVAALTPTSCLTDGLNYNANGDNHLAAWHATWSTSTSFTVPRGNSPTPSQEPALGLALRVLAQAKCSTEGSEVIANSMMPASMSGVARIAIVTTLYRAASTLHHWLQRVPPWPPDPWNFFLGKHGFLLSDRSDLEAQMPTSPNQSFCTVLQQSQDYNTDSFFSKRLKLLLEWNITGILELHHSCLAVVVVHLCRYRLLTKGPCGLITARGSLCATLKSAVILFFLTTSSCDGKYLLVHAPLRSFWFESFPTGEPWSYWQGKCNNKLPSRGGLAVCQLIICNGFSETIPTTKKSEVVQGNLSSSPNITVNGLCNLSVMWCLDRGFLRIRNWWLDIQCFELVNAISEVSFWPERHIIGSYLQVLITGSQLQMFLSGAPPIFLLGIFPETSNQLNFQRMVHSCLGIILVQITTSQMGAASCFGGPEQRKFPCARAVVDQATRCCFVELKYWPSWFMPLTTFDMCLKQSVTTHVGIQMVKNTCKLLEIAELCSAHGRFDAALRGSIDHVIAGLQESYVAMWEEGAALLIWKTIGLAAEHQTPNRGNSIKCWLTVCCIWAMDNTLIRRQNMVY